MLDKYLIEHCSPTLASLKSASLFTLAYEQEENLISQLEEWNQSLQQKGIMLVLLRKRNNRALIYLCRYSHLKRDLNRPGVFRFLSQYGYQSTELQDVLAHLAERLVQCESFPHEIGVFLGYPLGDVIGFIQNAGQNSKCSGCWKVYCNECEAIQTFAKYKKCKDVYMRLWNQGRSVLQLTVAA